MPSVSLWASSAEILFLICEKEKPAGFSFLFFHGRSRNGKRHLLPLAPCGSIRVSGETRQPGGKPTLSGASRQLSRRESQDRGGHVSCLFFERVPRAYWECFLPLPLKDFPRSGEDVAQRQKRGQGVTEGDGEGAPAPLRGAAAAAAEGP